MKINRGDNNKEIFLSTKKFIHNFQKIEDIDHADFEKYSKKK
jgi:hypothetical protein